MGSYYGSKSSALRYHFAVMPTRKKYFPGLKNITRRATPNFYPTRLLAVLFVLALTACATTGPSWTPEQDKNLDGSALFAEGAYEAAAEAWQQQALDTEPQQADGLRVRAADAWLLAGKPSNAADALRWVDREALTPPDASRLGLVLADMALRNNRPDEAELLLQAARKNLSPTSRQRYDSLYARFIQQISTPGSREISEAAKISNSMPYYDPGTSVDLIRSLENVSSGELAIRADNPRGERQLTGWLDLTLVIRQNLVIPDGVSAAIGDWKLRNPYHLLTVQQALDTWLRYRQLFTPPRKVAVLLPQSGRLHSAGEAIRDGLMSAYLDNPGGAEILFFATGDDEQSAISAYFNALDAGADWIIGPLKKESVEAMLNLAGMSTPVLALNDLPVDFIPLPGLSGQIASLSLSQDVEASSIAGHALSSGYRKALVMAPEDAWGERMATAFESEFLQEDGEIIAATRYLESQNDHTAALERVLKIDESKARKKRLQNTLQMTLEFEPVHRQDIDVIFLAASASQARLIRPQFRFHEAGDIPIYATSRIYSGQPERANNLDLDGIRFPAAPWQLTHPSDADIPDFASIRRGSRSALFALGQDAWNLLPWLSLMHKDPDFVYPGQSGYYRSPNGEALQREPAWAEFKSGLPVPLRTPTGPATH
jgi:outer membrane PBP1 activator LpoA protein